MFDSRILNLFWSWLDDPENFAELESRSRANEINMMFTLAVRKLRVEGKSSASEYLNAKRSEMKKYKRQVESRESQIDVFIVPTWSFIRCVR